MFRGATWVQNLTSAERVRLEAGTTEREISAGSSVSLAGDSPGHWVGVIEGVVKLHAVGPSGRAISFAWVLAGEWFGEDSLLGRRRSRYDVVALQDCRLAFLDAATFYWLLEQNIEFSRFVLRQANERFQQCLSLMEADRLLDADTRILNCVREVFSRLSGSKMELLLRVCQDEVAALAGISRQRTNLALRRLATSGLLRLEYGRLSLTDGGKTVLADSPSFSGVDPDLPSRSPSALVYKFAR